MLEQLQDNLLKVVKNIKGQGKISEANVSDTLRDIRIALLEADVSLSVVKKFVEHVIKFCINNHSCVNAAIQFGGIAALDGEEKPLTDMMERFSSRRKIIHEGLNSLKGVECSLPGGAFYVFPNIKGTGMSGTEFAKKCLYEAGVAVVPGTSFGKFAKDYTRFSFAASRDSISQSLEKIKKIL